MTSYSKQLRSNTGLSGRTVSLAACLLRLWIRFPQGAWLFVYCDCCVLSGRGHCDEPITRPEEFYRLWCVVACDLETSRMRRPWHELGRRAVGVGEGERRAGKLQNKSDIQFYYLLYILLHVSTIFSHLQGHYYHNVNILSSNKPPEDSHVAET